MADAKKKQEMIKKQMDKAQGVAVAEEEESSALVNKLGQGIQKQVDINIANEKEKEIAEMEMKKKALSNKLKSHIANIKLHAQTNIIEKNFFDRLIGKIPSGVNLTALKQIPMLVKDKYNRWPSFSKVLYCQLDYDNLILFILFYSLFKWATGNSVISITLVYIIEKGLWFLRQKLGEGNLARKTLIDEKFLMWYIDNLFYGLIIYINILFSI